MGADDRDRARPDDHVLQRRLAAGRARRDGQEFRGAADNGRYRHRGLFDAGGRLCHAGRQARAAVRRAAGFPLRRRPVLRVADIDDIQPHGDHDDHGAGALRRGRRGHRAVAGGADRGELHRAAAGDGRRRAGLGAGGGRGAGVHHRRRAGHLYRLASGVRNFDCGFGHRFPVELPSQARLRPTGCADRHPWRRSGGVCDRSHQFRIQQPERLGACAGDRQCAVRPARPFAGAGHDRSRRRARAGVSDRGRTGGRRRGRRRCWRSR